MSETQTLTIKKPSVWKIPIWLLVLTFVPITAGIFRVIGLATHVKITPENSRFFESPTPVILHIMTVTVYCVLGAFQFSSALRKRNLNWHRISGRLLVPSGIISAVTGLWMTVFYPLPSELQGPLLLYFRIFVGFAMIACLILGFSDILKRKISSHRGWMIRAYAIGQGAGTQVVVFLPWAIYFGTPDQLTRDILMVSAWIINIAIAEWIIRK